MRYLFVLIILVFSLSSCRDREVESHDKPLIVVTTSLLADAIHNIVQDSANVQSLMGAGVDPHLYKASLGDLEKLMEADYIFYQGLHLEGKLGEVLDKLSRTKNVMALADEIPEQMIRKVDVKGNVPDPHIWFNVKIWKEVVLTACEKLSVQIPGSASYFESNTAAYIKKLDSLDRYVEVEISKIPESRRVLITSHDAFNYFGAEYHIEVKGLQGISTLSEFGLRDVSDLVKMIIERDIQAVFVETSVSSKSLNAVVAGVREKGKEVRIGGTLYTDALGEPSSAEGTYIGMMEYNVNTIVKALR
ncbi:metal ABC transporter solute-binding protein, Zn/Mn family [Albibacterium sp.]|uniref:metal ABC transporter solute-binding protein, Zn/Mn family n=1 Tax=Albibacterium sp. TaxID=2952885 RepID=UPI002C48BB85|nr:zinc ABC transporter substrate-binding protein [Albibacterium sp.]HUH18375.1 zinc ABC transporter substrate-binding protein [Albibacterium sp.]